MLPEKHQRKYLEFFMGVVLIILVLSPLLRLTGLEQRLDATYARQTYDQELQEFLRRQEKLEAEYQKRVEEELEKTQRELEEREMTQERQEAKQEQEETGSGAGIQRIQIEIEPLEAD